MPNIPHLLTQTFTYQQKTGVGTWGDPTYGAQATAKGRVEEQTAIFKDAEGNDKESTHTIATQTDIGQDSRVWIPGANTGDDNDSLKVIRRVAALSARDGIFLYEFYLGV